MNLEELGPNQDLNSKTLINKTKFNMYQLINPNNMEIMLSKAKTEVLLLSFIEQNQILIKISKVPLKV